MNELLSFLGSVPWWVWVIIGLIAIVLLYNALTNDDDPPPAHDHDSGIGTSGS